MNSKYTIPISEARKKIFDIAEHVQKPGVYFTLTEKGRAKAVMLSAEEFDSLIETLEVMRIFPDLEKEFAETDEAIRTGEYKKWTSLDNLLAEKGYILKDKLKKKYEVRRQAQAKSRKSSQKASRARTRKN